MATVLRIHHALVFVFSGSKPLALSDVGLVDEALGRSLNSVAELAAEVEQAKREEVR